MKWIRFSVLLALIVSVLPARQVMAVNRLPALADGLVSYWTMDELSDTRFDSMGANPLTEASEDPVNDVAYHEGKIGNAIYIHNNNDTYLKSLSEDFEITEGDSFTFSFWEYRLSTDTDDVYIAKGSNDGTMNYMFQGYFSRAFYFGGGVYGDFLAPETQWRYLTISLDGATGTFRFYVNGVLDEERDDSAVTVFQYTAADTPFMVGRSWHDGRAFVGYLDEMGFWDRALTQPEIVQLYNGGVGCSYPFDCPQSENFHTEELEPVLQIEGEYDLVSVSSPACEVGDPVGLVLGWQQVTAGTMYINNAVSYINQSLEAQVYKAYVRLELEDVTLNDELIEFMETSIQAASTVKQNFLEDEAEFLASYVKVSDKDLISDQVGYTVCYAPPAPASPVSLISDGNMEQQPRSDSWFTHASTTLYGRNSFGRMSSYNPLHFVTYGLARCGSGYQTIGEYQSAIILGEDKGYSAIKQVIYVNSPGSYNYRYSVSGKSGNNWPRPVPYKIWMTNVNTNVSTTLVSATVPGDHPSWHDITGTVTLAGGSYNLFVDLREDAISKDFVRFDDIQIANYPLSEACAEVTPPVPQPTPTLNTPEPGYNYLQNCGFEQGRDPWIFDPSYNFIYNDANNHGIVNAQSGYPGIRQEGLNWPGGPVYVQFDTAGSYLVSFRTGSRSYIAARGTAGETWSTIQASINLPADTYNFELMRNGSTSVTWAGYDNLSVSATGYSDCEPGTHVTPTPNSSPTVQMTPTMFATNTPRPTITMLPSTTPVVGQPTATTRPTFTPQPTYTPYPTFTAWSPPTATATERPTATQTLWSTWTPQPTYTPYPTYTQEPTHTMPPTDTVEAGTNTPTAQPTYTPYPTYTPGIPGLVGGLPTQAPPQQPPPAYYADCDRPQNGFDMAHWVDYEKCQTLSFFSWSPNAQATYEAMPTAIAGREPGGTLDEVTDTINQVGDMINNTDWGEPLPGTGDAPSLDTFFGDENSPWITGEFTWDNTPVEAPTQCSTRLAGLIGLLAQGYCLLMNFLASKGILAWIQLLVNIGAIAMLIVYIWHKWIDAGAGG